MNKPGPIMGSVISTAVQPSLHYVHELNITTRALTLARAAIAIANSNFVLKKTFEEWSDKSLTYAARIRCEPHSLDSWKSSKKKETQTVGTGVPSHQRPEYCKSIVRQWVWHTTENWRLLLVTARIILRHWAEASHRMSQNKCPHNPSIALD